MAKKDDSTEAAPAAAAAPIDTTALDKQIAETEAALAELKAKRAAAERPAYPKARYKAEETVQASIASAREVPEAKGEADAAKDGYTYDVPTGKDGK